jgi:hypothetical protein
MIHPYRRIPIEQITRKAVKDVKHNYIALYDLSYDPLADIYYITIGYIHNENLDLQLSVTQSVTRSYVKERRHSTNFDSEIVSMIDGMIRGLKHDFWYQFNISIAIENDTFIDFIGQLQDAIKNTFAK